MPSERLILSQAHKRVLDPRRAERLRIYFRDVIHNVNKEPLTVSWKINASGLAENLKERETEYREVGGRGVGG